MKRLLNEDTTRKFMKLAKLEPLTNSFLEKVEEGTGKAGNQGRTDVANKVPKGSRWLKEEEEVSEDAEVTEEGFLSEQEPEEELPPMGDEPPEEELPPMEDEPEMEAGQEDLDVTAIVQAVTDALAQELEAQGHPVDIDVEGDGEEAPLEEPEDELGGEEPPLEGPEDELGGEEEPVLEDFDTAGITVEEDLDEEYLNEVTRRVAKRLLDVSKK